MCESLVGRIAATTLQNAGRPSIGVPSGGANGPDVLVTVVTMVPGS